MGQRLRQDKITALSESSGTITLAPGAVLTIGGQQYVIDSPLNVAANLMLPVNRYQIFAVLDSGDVQLVVSSNENSQGPAGYSSWKLVGSYYTNGLDVIGFGSFVNIVGVPRTNVFDAGKTIVYDSNEIENGAVSTDALNDRWRIQRLGKNMSYNFEYYTVNNTGADNGSSTSYIFWPRNLSLRVDAEAFGELTVTFARAPITYVGIFLNNLTYVNSSYAFYTRPYGVSFVESGNTLDSGKFPLATVPTQYSLKARDIVPIIQWDETPIEDL